MNGPDHDGNLLAPPLDEDRITLDRAFGTRFMLFIDTEEEFDWDAPFSRERHSVSALNGMTRGQGYFASAAVKPVYVAD